MSLVEAARVAVRRPRWVLVYPLAAALLALAATYLMAPRYTATVAFAPERLAASGAPAGLAGLAGQFGLNVLTDVIRSPAYYVSVLDSRQLKEDVLAARVTRDSVPVISLLRLKRGTRAESLAVAVGTLSEMTLAKEDPRTGIIRVSVETRNPDLSAAIAMRYVEALNRFNTSQRQSQARERRRFIEGRMTVAERAIRDAEESLRRFYQNNVAWSRTPTLVVEGARLRNGVDAARDNYLTLQREFELARIEEITDTPVLTIIDPAVAPLSRSKPRRKLAFAGVLGVGILLGLLAAFGADYIERARLQDPEAFRRWRR